MVYRCCDRMKLTRTVCQFTKWFHILGQSCYPPFCEVLTTNRRGRRLRRSLNYIPCAVTLIVTIFLTAMSCKFMNYHYGLGSKSGYILFATGVLSSVSIIFTSVIQSISYSSSFALLLSQINDIKQASNKDYTFDFQAFRRCFLKYLSIILGSSSLPVMVVLLSRLSNPYSYIALLTFSLLRMVSLLSTLHCLFYISLYDFMLKSFVEYVDKRGTYTLLDLAVHIRRTKFLKSEFNHYKLLHFKLWKTGKTIKQIFGWTLTVILFQNFLSGLFCVYYSLIVLYANGVCAEMLRKSIWKKKCSSPYNTQIFIRQLGPMFNFVDMVTSVAILINACHYCTILVNSTSKETNSLIILLWYFYFRKSNYLKT